MTKMERRTDKDPKSQTLPSSPTHSLSSSSSSSSDFEFTICLSPRKSSATNLCPADELFYKGQLLPLHLSPRISMVRTLLLASSDTTTTGSSHSASSFTVLLATNCDSSRPSSVTEEDDFINKQLEYQVHNIINFQYSSHHRIKRSKNYFSFSRLSSVFRKEPKTREPDNVSGSSSVKVKRMSAAAKEVIRKYMRKVKPLYEKLSQKQQMGTTSMTAGSNNNNGSLSHSFSGNLRYRRPRRRISCVSSCPSSMRSSPNRIAGMDTSSMEMEDLQSAIQGAIAHCKNSMIIHKNNKTMVGHDD